MKSFFDFIGRTEATQGARRWSWIKKNTISYPQLNNFVISITAKKAVDPLCKFLSFEIPVLRFVFIFCKCIYIIQFFFT